jgi:dolichyl-phosphate beta-glucosyltransferase
VTNIQARALHKVADYLNAQGYTYEVLIVDDGSQDQTAALAEDFAGRTACFRVIRNPHRGKAHAVATGMLAAQGEIVLFSDMDQATPIGEVSHLLPWFDRGYDVVIGSRGTRRRNAPWWRRLMSRSQIILRNVILGFRDITDTQCGFKAFRRASAEASLSRLSIYAQATDQEIKGARVTSGFDVELLFVAKKLGYRIKEVPVEWDYQRSRRVNLLKDSLRGLGDLLRIRLADLRGAYKTK